MKRLGLHLLLSLLLLALSSQSIFAQRNHHYDEVSLADRVGLLEKSKERFKLYLHLHSHFTTPFTRQGVGTPHFATPQIRIEAMGKISERFSYQWRQQLNRTSSGVGQLDNLPDAINVAGIGYEISPKWSLFFGKQAVVYGGYEYSKNPIEVYQYSDLGGALNAYHSGVKVAFRPSERHEWQLQIVNSRNGSYQATYPQVQEAETKLPLFYTFNWNGTITNFWQTRYSVSYMPQSHRDALSIMALGNRFEYGMMSGYVDVMYSNEGLNRRMIIPNAYDVEYLTTILKLYFQPTESWRLFAKGMYETASEGGSTQWFSGNLARTSFGYMGGAEYFPFADGNFRFYLTYVGGHAQYKESLIPRQEHHRVMLGLIYQLKLF